MTARQYMLASGGSTRIAAMNGKTVDWEFVLRACNSYDELLAKVDKLSKAVCRRAENEEKALKKADAMREALNAADEWIDRMAGLRDNDTTSRDVLRRIRAAVAKATGVTP